MKNKTVFYTVWIAALFLVPASIFANSSFSDIAKNASSFTGFIQRFLGLTAYMLLFFQVILGAFMQKWKKIFGEWVLNFHIIEGAAAYTLIVLHTASFMLSNYFAGLSINPFFVFVDLCALCSTRADLYYTLGRVSFWLITVSVLAVFLRAATPYMRVNWRKFHALNYIAFLAVGLHGFFLGTDYGYMPFAIFAVPAYLTVLAITVFIKLPEYLKKF